MMKEKMCQFLAETPYVPQEQKTAYSGEILFLRNPITMEPSRENGCAALVIEDNCYHLYALFSDSDIFNDGHGAVSTTSSCNVVGFRRHLPFSIGIFHKWDATAGTNGECWESYLCPHSLHSVSVTP